MRPTTVQPIVKQPRTCKKHTQLPPIHKATRLNQAQKKKHVTDKITTAKLYA